MKIIEIPATLRVFVPDNTSDEQIKALSEGMTSNTCGTVEEEVLDEQLKKHIKSVGGNADLLIGSDLWVSEICDSPVVHASP